MELEIKVKNGFYTNVTDHDPAGNIYEFSAGLAKPEDVTIRLHHMYSYNLKERFDKNLLVQRLFSNPEITELEEEQYNPQFYLSSKEEGNEIPGNDVNHLTFLCTDIDGIRYVVTNMVIYEGKPVYLQWDERFAEGDDDWDSYTINK